MRISDWSSDVCSSDLPVDRVDALGKGRLDPVDHVADLGLGRGGEIFLGIGAAHRVAEIGVERRERPLVTAALLRRARKPRAIESEMGVVDRARQHIGMAVDLVERSEEHTSELQSLMRISYAVFC